MQWINDLKVAYKLLILCVIAALGMAIIGYSGYSSLQESKRDMDIMFNQNMKSLYYVGNCRHAMRYMQGMMLIATSTHDQERIKSVSEKYEAGKKELETNLEKFREIAANNQHIMATYEEVKKDWDGYRAALDKSMSLAASGRNEEGRTYYDKNGAKLATSLGAHFVKLSDVADKEAEAITHNTEEKNDATSRNMMIQSFIILIVLIGSSLWITKAITTPLYNTMDACAKLRDGDFRDTASAAAITRRDEFGELLNTVASMRTTINKLMHTTSDSAEQLASAAEELTASATQSAQASDMVANSVTNAAGAVVEQQQHVGDTMGSVDNTVVSIENLNEIAQGVSKDAALSQQHADSGASAVETAIGKIIGVEKIVNHSATMVDKLGKSSQEIGQIVETISSIAEQTNLLALNAAIEAARAGEHGRGFAVVADEVRKLAEESQSAAQKITGLISGIQSDTSDAVSSMQEGSAAVKEGTRSVEELRETFQQIRSASGDVANRVNDMTRKLQDVSSEAGNIKERSSQISSNSGKVASEMETVSAASEEQSASSNEIAHASSSLANLAQQLQVSLNKFKF